MAGSTIGGVCCLVPGGIVAFRPIESDVVSGTAVAADFVVSGGAAVAAAIVVADGTAVASAVVGADVRKLLSKILFCIFRSSSSFASGTLCSAAIAAAVFVIAAAAIAVATDGKRVSNSSSISLSIRPTISSIVSSSGTLSCVSTLDFGAPSHIVPSLC